MYLVTYSIPLAGSFLVSIGIDRESVKYCVGPSRECCLLDDEYLSVTHCELHGVSLMLAEEEGLSGLSNAIVGVETGFLIKSHDKFGNLRSGSSTPHLDKSGDGMSDAFLVSFAGPSCNTDVTSTAAETFTCFDSSIPGYSCLLYGGNVTEDILHNFSSAAMQVVLSLMHGSGSNPSLVQVSQSTVNGNYQWKITFVDHLKLWSQHLLSVLPGSDGFSSVSDKLSVAKQPSAGVYPVCYTLWEKGTYELNVFASTTLVLGF